MLIVSAIIVFFVLKSKKKHRHSSDNDTVKVYGALNDIALQGNWESENGRWCAFVNGQKITLSLDDEVLFDNYYTGKFVNGNNKAVLSLGVKWLRRRNAAALRLKALYRENDKLYITTIDPDKRRLAFDDMRETVVLTRKER